MNEENIDTKAPSRTTLWRMRKRLCTESERNTVRIAAETTNQDQDLQLLPDEHVLG